MKQRLDLLLTERHMVPSREQAKKLIQEGAVSVGGHCLTKAGTYVPSEAEIVISDIGPRYVSRGGLKLEKALRVFSIDLNKKVCLDIGASTGGFTDCMLQNGAARVYAVDAGSDQLALSLREDPRVVSMEHTNVRYLTPADLPEQPGFASIDVSFISLDKVLGVTAGLLAEGASFVALIKPQFEAGKNRVGKNGVVKDAGVHTEILQSVILLARSCGLRVLGVDYSPVKGPRGNIEYLIHLQKYGAETMPAAEAQFLQADIRSLVKTAHQSLKE